MSDVTALDQKIETLRSEVTTQLRTVSSDMKELTRALRELIRLDGDIKNLSTLVTRVGGQVDDHEKRLRRVETSSTVNTVKVGSSERFFWIAGAALFSVLSNIIVYVVTR